jgi:hypothetical protein
MCDYVAKPVRISAIRETIERWCTAAASTDVD